MQGVGVEGVGRWGWREAEGSEELNIQTRYSLLKS
jgi:hypothetical protein